MELSIRALTLCFLCCVCLAKPPVILVPGLGGSQLWGKLNKTDSPNFYCKSKTSDYILLWLDVSYLLPFSFNCLTDNIRMIYDPVTRTTRNREGVDIKVGEDIEYLSNIEVGATAYYYNLVNFLVKKHGYERNVTIRGAPYDFRKAPNENQKWLINMKKMVEESYARNNKQRVLIVAHSLGCLYILHFLQRQSQAWKDQYIEAFVSVAGPYGGSLMTLQAQASGDNLKIWSVKGLWGRPVQRSSPSGPYLFPKKPFWSSKDVLAMTDKRNYTVDDYESFFRDMNYSLGYEIYTDVRNLTNPLVTPGVKVYCVLGRDVPTSAGFDWRKKDFPDDDPTPILGDGDGTVNWRSLRVCSEWDGRQKQPVRTIVLSKQEHLGILKDDQMLNVINAIIS